MRGPVPLALAVGLLCVAVAYVAARPAQPRHQYPGHGPPQGGPPQGGPRVNYVQVFVVSAAAAYVLARLLTGASGPAKQEGGGADIDRMLAMIDPHDAVF